MKKSRFTGALIIVLLCGAGGVSAGAGNSISETIENALSEEFYQFPGSYAEFEKSSIWIGDDCIYWYDDAGFLERLSFPRHRVIMRLRRGYRHGVVIRNLDFYTADIDSSGGIMLREVDSGMVRLEGKKRMELDEWRRILARFRESSSGLRRTLYLYRKQSGIEKPFSLGEFPLDFDNALLNIPGAKLEYFIDPYGGRLEVDSRFRIIEPEIIRELRAQRRRTEFRFLHSYLSVARHPSILVILSIPFMLIIAIPVLRTIAVFAKKEGGFRGNFRAFMVSIYRNLCKPFLIIFLIFVSIIADFFMNSRLGIQSGTLFVMLIFLTGVILMTRAVWK